MIRRRISTIITKAQRPGKDAVHRGVGGEHRAGGFQPLTQRRLQVAGDGDDDGRRLAPGQFADQVQLLIGPQGSLQHDDFG
jgi:hypothetical protein